MSEILKVKLVLNKRNGQVNMALPRRKLSSLMKDKIKHSKNALIKLEGFE